MDVIQVRVTSQQPSFKNRISGISLKQPQSAIADERYCNPGFQPRGWQSHIVARAGEL